MHMGSIIINSEFSVLKGQGGHFSLFAYLCREGRHWGPYSSADEARGWKWSVSLGGWGGLGHAAGFRATGVGAGLVRGCGQPPSMGQCTSGHHEALAPRSLPGTCTISEGIFVSPFGLLWYLETLREEGGDCKLSL